MSNQTVDEQTILNKLRTLPAEKAAEVEDFIDFLVERNEAQQSTKAAMQASEPAFQKVWDNPEDTVYDEL